MTFCTSTFTITYLTPAHTMASIPSVDKAQMERIESLLETVNVPPGNSDLDSVLARLNALETLLTQDSSAATFVDSNFEICTTGQEVTLHRFGNVVHMASTVRCKTTDYTSSATGRVFLNVPTGFRPAQYFCGVMHDVLGESRFYLRVNPDGTVEAARAGSHYNNYWMSLGAMWLTNDR